MLGIHTPGQPTLSGDELEALDSFQLSSVINQVICLKAFLTRGQIMDTECPIQLQLSPFVIQLLTELVFSCRLQFSIE